MIVFGYAKDIAPINSVRLHIDHFRLHPKAGLKQHLLKIMQKEKRKKTSSFIARGDNL